MIQPNTVSPRLGGLLQSVLEDPELQSQFEHAPNDLRTVQLSGDTPPEIGVTWGAVGTDADDTPTIEWTGDSATPLTPDGFVPIRLVETLSEQKRDDADYRIVGQLGGGGMGVVYQAHQRAIDREVALKVLREELSSDNASRQRFLTEARVIGGLDHPNVIALHEVCVDAAGRLFYSMKRVNGTSWDQRIADMTLEQNVDTLLRVADAIRYAHSRGLIHRDIKPENVMLGTFGEVLLADWGLAIEYANAGPATSIGGTPAYMAPELASSDQAIPISPGSDIYLLGATLFQILTGLPPHQGESLLSCVQAAARNEIRPTKVEGELMDIAMKAMSTHPDDRYPDVESFIQAVKDQRVHDESTRMARRACDRISHACDAKSYEDFRVAEALLVEAIQLWPENQRALQMRHRLTMEFAKTAVKRGDLKMALSLYETAGEADSDEAAAVRAMIEQRADSEKHVSRYSALFVQSPQAGLLIDTSTGTVVEANQRFADLSGYPKDEIDGRPVAELSLFKCPKRRVELVRQLRANGTLNDFEATMLHADGHAMEMLINSRLVEVDGVEMVVSTFHDISIRKRAERALEQNQQRLRDLQRLAGLGTWSFDVKTEKVTWSDEAFALAGRRPEEGVPSKEEYMAMIHPEDRQRLQEAFTATVETGAAYELYVRQRGPGGQYRNVLMRGQPILDEDGNTVEVYGVVIPQR